MLKQVEKVRNVRNVANILKSTKCSQYNTTTILQPMLEQVKHAKSEEHIEAAIYTCANNITQEMYNLKPEEVRKTHKKQTPSKNEKEQQEPPRSRHSGAAKSERIQSVRSLFQFKTSMLNTHHLCFVPHFLVQYNGRMGSPFRLLPVLPCSAIYWCYAETWAYKSCPLCWFRPATAGCRCWG